MASPEGPQRDRRGRRHVHAAGRGSNLQRAQRPQRTRTRAARGRGTAALSEREGRLGGLELATRFWLQVGRERQPLRHRPERKRACKSSGGFLSAWWLGPSLVFSFLVATPWGWEGRFCWGWSVRSSAGSWATS